MSEKPDLGFKQYPTQNKSKVNKWIKIGVPVLILVVLVAVLAGVFGSRAAKKQDSNLAANSDAAATSEANAQSSIRAELGRFATATDEYFLPVYPSTVSAHLSHVMVRSWQKLLDLPKTRFACVPGIYEIRLLTSS